MRRRRFIRITLAFAGALTLPAARSQSSYPNKPIRIIAPVAPGGGVDLVARTMAERLGKVLGASIIVENMAGGGGAIAAVATARAAPDGYTLMLGYVGTHGTNPAVRKLPYDALKDFTAIGMVGGTPNVLVINSEQSMKDLREFIDYARRNPSRLSYGSSGPGTLTHLAMEQFKLATGIFMVHVPYRGIGPAITDLIGGQTQAMFPGLAAALPHIKGGRLRPLAVTGLQRHRLIAQVPTLQEAGLDGFDGVQWYGIVGPAAMPPALVQRLNDEICKLIVTPELGERLSSEAIEPMPMSPEQFANYIRDDIAKWTKLAKARKIELD